MEQTVEVDSGYGVTIPQEMLDRLNLAPGSKLSLELLEDEFGLQRRMTRQRKKNRAFTSIIHEP
jgi:bifunctional DNA-binding transcriptional regulator/antitoxin component of YhaV-PrlF toxin-antitoxin module